ncbi:MAG: glycoside hydrolase family 2 protein, partial [Spirochaetaceae bacterium]|nr:glycoside hydrolase family 2 protein [Spirochaetaceae bacterium]
FCSEFGFQSFPSLDSVASYAPENQRNITSPVMRHHQKNNAGNTTILSTMARYFRMPMVFEDVLYISQVQQAMAIRTAVEYWRSQRPVSMGALYWQLNDLWPVASWSSIEYSGKWKLLHYEARRFFAPLWLSLYSKDGKLQVTALNDNPADERGRVIVRLMGFDGSELNRWIFDDLCCPAGSAFPVLELPLAELEGEGARHFQGDAVSPLDEGFTDRFITAEWLVNGEQGVTPGTYPISSSLFLTKPRDCELADAHVSVSPGNRADTILLETDAPAFYVQAECDIPGRFDDAGFTLLPGEGRELRFLAAEGSEENTGMGALVERVKIRHLYLTY